MYIFMSHIDTHTHFRTVKYICVVPYLQSTFTSCHILNLHNALEKKVDPITDEEAEALPA
jgi:hypothetical protein